MRLIGRTPARCALALVVVIGALAVAPAVAMSSGTGSVSFPGSGSRSAADTVTSTAYDTAPAGRWVWPSGSDVVVNGWVPPEHDYGPGHRGVDVHTTIGSEVVAPDAGTVSFAGQVAGRTVVAIDHGGGLVSTLDAVAPSVATGETVARGERVGDAVAGAVSPGHCGSATACLHVGARVDGVYVDPTRYLGRPAWPVLLPLHDDGRD